LAGAQMKQTGQTRFAATLALLRGVVLLIAGLFWWLGRRAERATATPSAELR